MSTALLGAPWHRTQDVLGTVPCDATRCRNARDIRKEWTTESSDGETAGVGPVRQLAGSDDGAHSAAEAVEGTSSITFVLASEGVGGALSAGIAWPPARPRSPLSGPLKAGPGAQALLTSTVRQLVVPLAAIARTKAFLANIDIASMELVVFVDPEDESRELVLEIHACALGPQALAYWDSLGAALNDWRAKLSTAFADILAERLAVHVVWPPR